METPNLDREINDLEYYESNDELTDQGRRTLKEFRELKQLALCSVVKSFTTEQVLEELEDEENIYDARKYFKSLL